MSKVAPEPIVEKKDESLSSLVIFYRQAKKRKTNKEANAPRKKNVL